MLTEKIKTEQDIHHALEKFTNAWNTHDAGAFANLFAEDADFTNAFGKNFHGRQAIEAEHTAIFATMLKTSCLSKMNKKIRLIAIDLAIVDVLWNMTGSTDRKSNPWHDKTGLLVLTMKFVDNKWSILIMHNMDLPLISSN